MSDGEFMGGAQVLIVAGKGGVGKTAVSAALAVSAARSGLNTLIVELDGKESLAAMFGQLPLEYEEQTLLEGDPDGNGIPGTVSARTLTPDEALMDYLAGRGLQRISNRLVSTGLLDIIATAVPGIRDILVLGKVKQLALNGEQDLLIVDAPAAGHAITFLRSASGLADAVKVGPINTQANEVLDLLSDHERVQVVLVTIPEETPVNELIQTAYSLEEDVGVSLGPVVVNGIYPELAGLNLRLSAAAAEAGVDLPPGEAALLEASAEFRLSRHAIQDEQIERLGQSLPLPQLRIPYQFTSELGSDELSRMADALERGAAAGLTGTSADQGRGEDGVGERDG